MKCAEASPRSPATAGYGANSNLVPAEFRIWRENARKRLKSVTECSNPCAVATARHTATTANAVRRKSLGNRKALATKNTSSRGAGGASAFSKASKDSGLFALQNSISAFAKGPALIHHPAILLQDAPAAPKE
jgi:hypothetical protein